MKNLDFILFDANKADEELVNKFFDILDEWLLEMDPSRKLASREFRLKEMQEYPSHRSFMRYLIFLKDSEEKAAVGYINIIFDSETAPNYEENKHIANFYVYVTKNYRRKGLGKLLFKFILDKTDELGKNVIQSNTSLDTGKAFYERLGGKIVLHYAENRLYLKDVNWELMEKWRDEGVKLSEREKIILETYEKIPENIIQEFVDLYTETMNEQPYEGYAGRPKINVESRRIEEENRQKLNSRMITMITKESNNSVSGVTEVLFNPIIPHKIEQHLTGVKNEYRGRGLGKWLKANMIMQIREEFPNVEYVSTGNMDANAPMLSINERMGFKRFQSSNFYSFDKDKAREILLNSHNN
jgi:GNAT superfamily N-acetyltransferase